MDFDKVDILITNSFFHEQRVDPGNSMKGRHKWLILLSRKGGVGASSGQELQE